MPKDPSHLLIVDDDERLRSLLSQFLKKNDFFVSVAASAEEAENSLKKFCFDLIILDVMLPGQSGIDLTSVIRQTSDIPILLLTAKGETEDRILGLEAGCDDYIVKPFEPRELLLRIATILRRVKRGPETDIVEFGSFSFDTSSGDLSDDGRRIYLTSGEIALMTVLAQNFGAPVARTQLATQAGIDGSERAVDVQITRLRKKIETDPKQPVYLQTVRGAGYILRPGA